VLAIQDNGFFNCSTGSHGMFACRNLITQCPTGETIFLAQTQLRQASNKRRFNAATTMQVSGDEMTARDETPIPGEKTPKAKGANADERYGYADMQDPDDDPDDDRLSVAELVTNPKASHAVRPTILLEAMNKWSLAVCLPRPRQAVHGKGAFLTTNRALLCRASCWSSCCSRLHTSRLYARSTCG
jgi:hypothetical protein